MVKGTRKRVGWRKGLTGVGVELRTEAVGGGTRDTRVGVEPRTGAVDTGHRSSETVAEKIGSSERRSSQEMSAFQLLCGIFASNPC